jgi:hypothetical protein
MRAHRFTGNMSQDSKTGIFRLYSVETNIGFYHIFFHIEDEKRAVHIPYVAGMGSHGTFNDCDNFVSFHEKWRMVPT